jgi:hypothetical protein
MTLPRRHRPELGRGRRVLGASSHGHGVLRPILPAEPAALLKLSGVGADAFVRIHPTEPVLLLDDAGCQGGSRINVETTEEAALLDCAALRINSPAPYPPSRSPLLHTPRFGVEPVHPALANSTLALRFTSVLENLPSKARLWRLTTQAQRHGPRGRTLATATRGRGSLQRMVRPRSCASHTSLKEMPTIRPVARTR